MKLLSLITSTLAVAAVSLTLPTLASASPENPVIGFSIDDLRVERWTHDRDFFQDAAQKMGAQVIIQSADASEEKQVKQIENLISKKVDAIVIVPKDSKVLSNVIAEAKKAGIKIVSYDRLILGADIDAYVSFDNERVGYMQADAVLKARPQGNYYLLGGAPTDNNAKLLRAGQEKALQAAVDAKTVTIVGKQWVNDWTPANAMAIIENALTAQKNKIDAVIASNDGTAGGAIQALAAQGLAGKVAVSGQDCDLAAVKRVVDGTQTVTVYKPLKLIAGEAAKIALELVKGEKPAFNAKLNNNTSKEIDSVLLTPTAITKDNVDLVVNDGFYTKEQVYGK